MRRLIAIVSILAALAIGVIRAAHAQAPPQFCISPTLAQSLAAALQQDSAMLAMLNDAAQEQGRQAQAVAAAVAKQKAEDAKPATTPAAPEPAPAKP